MRQKKYDKRVETEVKYGKEADVFSMGMVLALASLGLRDERTWLLFWKELLSPRNNHDWLDEKDVDDILAEKFGDKLPDEIRGIVSKVLCGPEKRINIDEFVKEMTTITDTVS